MKNLLLLLLIPCCILLWGCPRYSGHPCPNTDTLRATIDSSAKDALVYKGSEQLRFLDISTKDTITFNGSEIQNGFDTILVKLEPNDPESCQQTAIVEFYRIKFANPERSYEKFEIKAYPFYREYSATFDNRFSVIIPGTQYDRSISSLCATCYDSDSVIINKSTYKKVYKIHFNESTDFSYVFWHKTYGVLNFPNGLINNHTYVLIK